MVSYINIWLLVVYAINQIFTLSIPTESAELQTNASSLRTSNFSLSHPIPFSFTTARILLIQPPFPPVPPKKQISTSISQESPNNMAQQLTTRTSPITITLNTEPRIHLKAWTKAVHKSARSMIPAQDHYGALSLVCNDTAWAQLRRNIVPSAAPGGNPTIRPRPVYP